MADDFHHVIANLWTALGLSSPKFRPEGITTLTVDGLDIKLALTGDGRHIAVSSKAGQLSANPSLMDEQITRLLTSNLRTLPHHRAGSWLDDQDSPTPVVVVQGISPCSSAAMDCLVGTIGDVAHLAGEYGRELSGHSAQPRAQEEGLPDDMVIFRP
jgi:hypothetical protein